MPANVFEPLIIKPTKTHKHEIYMSKCFSKNRIESAGISNGRLKHVGIGLIMRAAF